MKNVHALNINGTKLASRGTFIVNFFALANKKNPKSEEKTFFEDCMGSLDLSL